MVAPDVEHFFLQQKKSSTWENLESSKNFSDIKKILSEQSKKYQHSKVRIVRSIFEQVTKTWSHQQILFLDLNQTNYLYLVNKSQDGAANSNKTSVEKSKPEKAEQKAASMLPQKTKPRKNKFFKAFGIVSLLLICSVFGLYGILYYQFPIAFQQLSPFNFLKPHTLEVNKKAFQANVLEPLTIGAVHKSNGVSDDLFGRWTIKSCQQNYIEFAPFDLFIYSRSSSIKPSRRFEINETIEDKFQFFLKLKSGQILHYLKVSPVNMRYAGITDQDGFQENSRENEVYRRCK